MDEPSNAFEIRKDLSDLVTELPKVSEGLAHGAIADRFSNDNRYDESRDSLAMNNTKAASYLLYLAESHKAKSEVTLIGVIIHHAMRMSGPLPIVTEKTIKEVDREYNLNKDLYSFSHYDRIKHSNPGIYEIIKKFSLQTEDIEISMKVLTLFYRVFERQAELNKMKIS